MYKNIRIIILPLLAAMVLLTGCSGSDDSVPSLPKEVKKVSLLFSINGLGDASYNDKILGAASKYAFAQEGMELDYLSPKDLGDAEAYFLRWLQQTTEAQQGLMVLVDNAYEELLDKYRDRIDPERHCILQLDSRRSDLPAHTSYIHYYGACYWAALMTSTFTGTEAEAAIMKANNLNPVLNEMEQGFRQGVEDAGSEIWITWVLDPEGNGGFDMPQTAYWMVGEVPASVSTVYAFAGGSNMGVYRFTREHPATFMVPGIDTDQSGLSNDVPYSVVKHVDRLLVECITRWDNGQPQPASPHEVGLADGYTDLIISPEYDTWFGNYMDYRQTAIEKEAAYDNAE